MHVDGPILVSSLQRKAFHKPPPPTQLLNLTTEVFFYYKDPIYLQSIIIHSANGGKGEGWHVEEYSVALLC
jgi:hypothetical protein